MKTSCLAGTRTGKHAPSSCVGGEQNEIGVFYGGENIQKKPQVMQAMCVRGVRGCEVPVRGADKCNGVKVGRETCTGGSREKW